MAKTHRLNSWVFYTILRDETLLKHNSLNKTIGVLTRIQLAYLKVKNRLTQ